MPRTLDPRLLQVLDRANPNVCDVVEVNAVDVGQVLRRAADQFLLTPPLVSETPAASLAADPAGAITIASDPAGTTIANFAVRSATTVQIGHAFPIPATTANHEDIARGMQWAVDPAFGRAVLQSFSATVQRKSTNVRNDLLLQIYRRRNTATRGVLSVFVPVLATAARWKNTEAAWTADSGRTATVTFDFTDQHIELGLENLPPLGDAYGEEQTYYFVLTPANATDDDLFVWFLDQTTATQVPNIGTFTWAAFTHPEGSIDGNWLPVTPVAAGAPCSTLVLKAFDASTQLVYALDCGATPQVGSVGRVVFERGVATGTSATLELSTAGSGGPWTAVSDGDAPAIAQQTYHVRVTLTASADHRRAPRVSAVGVEFRTPIDVSAEAIVDPIAQQIDVPFLAAGIGEGSVTVLRTGQRDHRDPGSDLASRYAASQLEVDVRLGSRHPLVPRAAWLLGDRAFVNNRTPGASAEQFGLLSYLKILKQKIPVRTETVNTVHTVTAATPSGVTVTPELPEIQGSNLAHAYSGQGYYLRVRQSTQAGVGSGYLQTIDDNTAPDTVTFIEAMPGTLAAGDVVEVHSAQFAQIPLTWQDADPADVWWEILTVHCAVPPERIGRSDLAGAARSGMPPHVADRAPGDPATQAKLTVTLELKDAEDANTLIDQLSFLMGGATVEIAGQICFRQIYPLRDPNGNIVVAPEPIAATFDVRNTSALATPVGLEQRIPSLACDYGVNTTAVGDTTPPALTTVFADADALAWLEAQPVDDLAAAAVPDTIARWCYNSSDQGAYLAGMLTQQVVRAASTGLRVWTWNAVDRQPQVVVGDRVVVITDQYTDYDPARQLPIRGWWAFPLVVVSVAGGGRQFRGYMLGLSDAVQLRGGPGELVVSAPYTVIATPTESANSGTVTLVVTDPSNVFKTTAVDGTVVAAISWHVTVAGVTTIQDSTTKPGTGTAGTYTKTVTLDPLHPIMVVAIGHFTDDTHEPLGSWTFDYNKVSDVANLTVANQGPTATVTVDWDTDTQTGANGARYSLDGGSTWTSTVTVTAALLSQFNIARLATKQTLIVQAKNKLDGAWGNQSTVEIDAYVSEGPAYDVHVVEAPTFSSIYWSVTNGTATLSINGGAGATPPASPFAVTRPPAGGTKYTYTFTFVAGGQTITDSVDVLPIDADTVTPNLTVTPGAPTATTQPYTVFASNPKTGGAANTLSATNTGCTMTIGATTYPDGSTVAITSSTIVTANRPSSTTTTQAKLKFDASVTGGGTESIVVDVTPQLNLGPSLQVNATPATSSYSITWTGTGTITLSIDGGSFATPPSSPITVTRNSTDHVYTFQAVADGQTVRQQVLVPALGSSGTSGVIISSVAILVTSEASDTFEIDVGPIYGTYDHLEYAWLSPDVDSGAEHALGSTNTFTSTALNPDSSGSFIRTAQGYCRAYDAASNLLASAFGSVTFKAGPSF
ncbi:MAG TPA: hypothetical protein VHB25_08600 [Gemmatimonadaceae bacterium]|nr:hypothetical protein [Gemmatimonadaceae bacterium]